MILMSPKKKIQNTWLTDAEVEKLIEVAMRAREHAFCHRSNHKIGASVLTRDGCIFEGCNVESVISGLGTCAERCAIDHAVAHGHYNFRAICCVDSKLTPCCGACLQYVLLFSQVAEEEIYLVNASTSGGYEVEKLSDALPDGYRTESNLEAIHEYGKKKGSKKKRARR